MEFINEHQERAVIEALTSIVNGQPTKADSESKKAIQSFIEQVKEEREWERWNVHCNTDCFMYRNGTCPFKHNDHYKCFYYADLVP